MICKKYNFRNIAIIMQPCNKLDFETNEAFFLNTCCKKYTEMINLTSEILLKIYATNFYIYECYF